MKIIGVEGPDFSGKTKLSTLISEMTGYPRIKFPNTRLETGKRLYEIINRKKQFDAEEFQILQNSNKKYTIIDLDPDGTYIFDRYTLSEIIYGKIKGLSDEYVRDLASKLPEPDFTIILHGNCFGIDNDIFSQDQTLIREMYYSEGFKIPSEKRLFLENNRRPEELVETVLKTLKGVGL